MSGRSAARPQRGGEAFARSHPSNFETGESAAKRPRFDPRNPSALLADAPEDDAFLDADEIGKRGQQTKRNAVNIDGYASDSSNEGFNARADAKAKKAAKDKQSKGRGVGKSKDEEDADMFADLEEGHPDGDEDEEVGREGKRQHKQVKFLDEDEIEGQVAGSRSGGHVSADFTVGSNGINSHGKGKGKAIGGVPADGDQDKDEDDSSEESDVDDAARADIGDADAEVGAGGKKKHAPKLDAFNMRTEQEEGRFDDQGNYVRKAADPDAIHDQWLEGVSKKDMKKAREAAEHREDEMRKRQIAEDAVLTEDILRSLIPHLQRGETVLEALARLNKSSTGRHKEKPKFQKNRRKADTDASRDEDTTMKNDVAEDPAESKRRAAIEAITGAADQLLTRGQTDIYESERELLTRQYARETGENWKDGVEEGNKGNENEDEMGVDRHATSVLADDSSSSGGAAWEYRWADARDGGVAHGPYDKTEIRSWIDAGYFSNGVEIRRIGTTKWSKDLSI